MATSWQIKQIHVLMSKIGIDTKDNRQEYEDILQSNFGKITSKALNEKEANQLIKYLTEIATEMGVWNRSRNPEYISARQFRMIWALWNEVSRVEPSKRRQALNHFLLNHFGVDIDHLYRNQVGKVIKTLKAMQK